jgi:monoamine oxidase
MRQRHRPRAVSYSPVTRRFREVLAAHAEAERRGIPVDEVAAERRELSEERRLTHGTSGPAILLAFPGGSTGENALTGAAHGKAPRRDVNWFLNQIDPIFPGTSAAYSAVAYEDHWSMDPWHRGAYSYWRLGEYAAFSGYEGVQEGNIHFAGEHTDPEEQGFLNGAVTSGERAASEVLHQI